MNITNNKGYIKWVLLLVITTITVIVLSGFIFRGNTKCKSLLKQCIKNIRNTEVQQIKRCLRERAICIENKNPGKICKKQVRNCILKSREEKSEGQKRCKIEYKSCIDEYTKGKKA